MSRITLVNPQITVSPWNTPLGNLDSTSIRFALAYLSACLKKAGHQVELVDLRLLKGWSDYEQTLTKQRPDFVGVTMHTCEFETAIECCQRAKRVDPNVTTVVGGIHPTMFPKECLSTGAVDFVLRGEGEISLPMLIDNPEKFSTYFWGEPPNLDSLPFPDRHLWPDHMERTKHPFWAPFSAPMVEMIVGRGCPYSCRFCCGPGESNLYTITRGNERIPYIRRRNVPNVIQELIQLYDRYKFNSIVFHDDQFITDPKWVHEFCQSMHRHGFVERGVKWWAAS